MLHNRLAKLREERENGEGGFTLIELLVVVVIIGVLVAIAIPLYLNYRKGSENRDAQSDVRNAVSAIEACIGDNAGKSPGTASTAVATTSTNNVINLTCTSAGAGTATAASSASTTSGDQTINVSDGVILTYTPGANNSGYTVAAYYSPSGNGHKTYTYTSSTGKTVGA